LDAPDIDAAGQVAGRPFDGMASRTLGFIRERGRGPAGRVENRDFDGTALFQFIFQSRGVVEGIRIIPHRNGLAPGFRKGLGDAGEGVVYACVERSPSPRGDKKRLGRSLGKTGVKGSNPYLDNTAAFCIFPYRVLERVSMRLSRIMILTGWIAACCPMRIHAQGEGTRLLLHDDFSALSPGLFSSGVIGAHAEYHYLPELAPKGRWAVTCFRSDGSQRAWRVLRDEKGVSSLYQSYISTEEERQYTHPFVIAGDTLWRNYTVTVRFKPDPGPGQSGLAFRYRNDQCYYFFGVDGNRAVLKKVKYNSGFRRADETILAQRITALPAGIELKASVEASGNRIRASLNPARGGTGGFTVEAEDAAFVKGKIGLLADVPTRYFEVTVQASAEAMEEYERARRIRADASAILRGSNPRMVLWKKLDTNGFGVGRNLRFGDLDGDGRIDVLIAQAVHHGPKDRNSETGCLTAMTFDGKMLWQNGSPDPWKDALTNDTAVQIHDIDGDGKNEVVYARDFEITLADGATGKTRYKIPTPETPEGDAGEYNKFPRILGDCLYFCDLRGTGRPRDLVFKDRYRYLWTYNDRLEPLWKARCRTGHYPFARDVDGDGRDELAAGYSLFDHDGAVMWSLDPVLEDHADGTAVVPLGQRPGEIPVLAVAASDEGMLFIDLKGNILKHHTLGHVQNPSIADFRADLPGLETVTMNFWGNQGIVHVFNAEGDVVHSFEPFQQGSLLLPVNWTGKPPEYFALSANPEEGGLFDGRGRKALDFPADGHPDRCLAALDLTGDCRDEIVVWDPSEIWVYTQSDNPINGRLYKPVRNPLWNESNYSARVSLPGWSE
jgi:rhamnogalacturonan endolyase